MSIIEQLEADARPLDPIMAGLLRRYRRAASRLRDGLEKAGGPEASSAQFGHSAESGSFARFDPPASFPILGALLRPFISRSSELNVWRVRDALQEAKLLSDEQAELLAAAFATASELGIAVDLDSQRITVEDVFFAYGEGHLYGDDPEGKALLARLSVGPMQALIPFMFHTACLNYLHLVDVLRQVAFAIEKTHSAPAAPPTEQGACIYCLGTDGTFETEEHVIPEAFGQDELVLVGCVCDACNNRLSPLDQYLAEEFEPLAMLRTVYVDLTKKGGFPKSRWKEADLEKTGYRGLRLNHKSGRSPITINEELPDGVVRFSMNLTGRKVTDWVRLGQALYKIGIALVAHDAGPDVARDARYNAAREFVSGARADLPGDLWLRTRAEPDGKLQTQWWFQGDQQTIVTLNFYGLWFVFDLDAGAERLALDNFPDFTAYPLSPAASP